MDFRQPEHVVRHDSGMPDDPAGGHPHHVGDRRCLGIYKCRSSRLQGWPLSSVVIFGNMTTTPRCPPLSKRDLHHLYESYFRYWNRVGDTSAFSSEDIETILGYVEALLLHVRHLEKIMGDQSEEVLLTSCLFRTEKLNIISGRGPRRMCWQQRCLTAAG
jgi:hypothetical protein